MNVFLLVFGALGDRWCKKRLYTLGVLAFALSSAGCSLSPTIDVLILFRLAQGVAAAMTAAVGASIIVMCFSKEKRGNVFGIIGSSVALGYLIGPSIGGTLFHISGWQLIFSINAPTGVVLACLFWKTVPALYNPEDGTTQVSERFDYQGAGAIFVFTLTFSLLLNDGYGRRHPCRCRPRTPGAFSF